MRIGREKEVGESRKIRRIDKKKEVDVNAFDPCRKL